ncbi:MAG: aldo/keto reductase [Phycisphaerales bacterium]|nr:aldo/keto reductase [Phycisphaerales bacterium]
MDNVAFGKTGLQVSRLGFGAAPIGYLKTDRERVGKILNLLLDEGVNVIDTAASYEGSEEEIARAVGHRRDEFVLISKCGGKVPQAQGEAWSAELIRNTVDAALRRLQTDRIDVMLLHSCDLTTLKKGEALGALVEAREAGKIGFAGYSGDNEAAAWAAGHKDVAVIETSVNLVDQINIDLVLPEARKHNVGVLAKRPIANSAWRGLEAFSSFYPHYVKPYWERFQGLRLTPHDLGFQSEQDWAEIALRFTLAQPGVHTAIIGTTNPDNARANIAAANKGPLPAEAVKTIRDAFKHAAAEGWPGLT